MLSEKSFYSDGSTAYIIKKKTDKTVIFAPVKSYFIEYGDISNAFLYDSIHKITTELDESKKPVTYKLKNNYSTRGLAMFYEKKNGVMTSMYELDGDTFTIEHNYG